MQLFFYQKKKKDDFGFISSSKTCIFHQHGWNDIMQLKTTVNTSPKVLQERLMDLEWQTKARYSHIATSL